MRDYRAYVIGRNGNTLNRVDLHCEDDEDAKERAKRLVEQHAVELWEGDRKVALFEPPH
jgi:hypothetical protein